MRSLTLWTMDKTVHLTGDRDHLQKGLPAAPSFTGPALIPQIQFSPTALAASIARTATLRPAPPEAVARLAASVLSDAEMLIAEGSGFALSPLLSAFADIEQTHFAGRVGAGITDLYMNALGYGWRDNAASLSSSLNPHGDFLYGGGHASGHGVVLAEARGSFAAKVSDAAMARSAQEKYIRQVKPFIDKSSLHGPVVHGYALAFGSNFTTGDTFLRLSQTRRPKSKPIAAPFPAPHPATAAVLGATNVPASLATATYRSNFILMQALPVADWIDWLGGARDIPEDVEPLHFMRFGYAGRSFLASVNSLLPYGPFYWRFEGLPDIAFRHPSRRRHWPDDAPRLDWFVMEEKAATAFLEGLSGRIRSGERERFGTFELPVGDIAGFAAGDADRRGVREDDDYALFRDGLALLSGPPPRKFDGIRTWHPKSGLS
jgi:hypothetical protein